MKYHEQGWAVGIKFIDMGYNDVLETSVATVAEAKAAVWAALKMPSLKIESFEIFSEHGIIYAVVTGP